MCFCICKGAFFLNLGKFSSKSLMEIWSTLLVCHSSSLFILMSQWFMLFQSFWTFFVLFCVCLKIFPIPFAWLAQYFTLSSSPNIFYLVYPTSKAFPELSHWVIDSCNFILNSAWVLVNIFISLLNCFCQFIRLRVCLFLNIDKVLTVCKFIELFICVFFNPLNSLIKFMSALFKFCVRGFMQIIFSKERL